MVREVEKEEKERGVERGMFHVTIGTAVTMVILITVGSVVMHIGDLVDFYTVTLAIPLLCVCHIPHVHSYDILRKRASDHIMVTATDVCCETCIRYRSLSVQKDVL